MNMTELGYVAAKLRDAVKHLEDAENVAPECIMDEVNEAYSHVEDAKESLYNWIWSNILMARKPR